MYEVAGAVRRGSVCSTVQQVGLTAVPSPRAESQVLPIWPTSNPGLRRRGTSPIVPGEWRKTPAGRDKRHGAGIIAAESPSNEPGQSEVRPRTASLTARFGSRGLRAASSGAFETVRDTSKDRNYVLDFRSDRTIPLSASSGWKGSGDIHGRIRVEANDQLEADSISIRRPPAHAIGYSSVL